MIKKIICISFIFVLLMSSISFATYSSIYSEPTILLKKGTYGTGVKWVQDMLNHNGYSLTVDGSYGTATYNAVISFQKSKGLVADGIVGIATRNALKNYANTATQGSYKYTTTNVNFRSGAGTSYNSYGVLQTNTKVYVYNVSNGWAYVKYNNTYGYISNQYLSSTITNTTSNNSLPTFNRNSSNLLTIIKNCKAYYANNNFYYSTASGVRTIPADKSTTYSGGKRYVDCSSYVTWVLYEYASANGNSAMKNYFSYQRNSATFANIGSAGGNTYLKVVDKKTSSKNININLAKPGDILVSNGHVEFYNSYTNYSGNYINIQVYNCGSDNSIKNPGITISATLDVSNITYILRVK